MTETAKKLVKTLFEEMWNQKKLEKADEVFSESCVIQTANQTWQGLKSFKNLISEWFVAFPDLYHVIDQIIVSEDWTTVRWRGSGTHLGVFSGILPTKKKIQYNGTTIFQIEGKKFSHAWLTADLSGILTPLKTFSEKIYRENDFVDDFKGPAAKIFERYMKARGPSASCRQRVANALRETFSLCPPDGKPELLVAPPLFQEIESREVFIPSDHGEIRSLIYLPKNYQDTPLPMMIYIHGGGWAIGSPESCDLVARKFALLSQTIVINVDYRMAPEYPYPHGLDDCVAAYKWAREKGKKEFNANDRVAIGGDSAGGNLAPAVVIRTRNERYPIPDACLMLCPLTDFIFEKYPSTFAYGYKGLIYDIYFLSFVRLNYSKYDEWVHPEVSPIYDTLEGFCPTFVLTGGRDLLYDENFEFVAKLKKTGAYVEHLVHPEMCHAYYYFLGLTKEEDEAYQKITPFLRKFLN